MPEKFESKIGKGGETLDKEKRIKEIEERIKEITDIVLTPEKANELTLDQLRELAKEAESLKKEKEKLEGKEEIEFKEAKKIEEEVVLERKAASENGKILIEEEIEYWKEIQEELTPLFDKSTNEFFQKKVLEEYFKGLKETIDEKGNLDYEKFKKLKEVFRKIFYLSNLFEKFYQKNLASIEIPFSEFEVTEKGELGIKKSEDIDSLFQALRHPRNKIREINLLNKHIGNENTSELAEILKDENNKLREVDLTLNDIGDDGVIKLAEALKDENNKLRKINLSYNHIKDEGARALVEALKNKNCKIIEINLKHNNIGDKTKEILKKICEEKGIKIEI
jgi:hypothetical protein